MKCTANRNCQIRNAAGRPVFYHRGDMEDFETCPPNWTEVGETKLQLKDGSKAIVFSELKDDVVRALDFDMGELKSYMSEVLPEVTYAHSIGHEALVEKYLYARGAIQERKDVLEANSVPALDPVARAVEENQSIVVETSDDSDADLDSLLED